MFSIKSSKQRIVLFGAMAGCLLTGLPAVTLAQSLPGLTLWGGVERKNELNYRLDFGGQADQWDRYRLKIPSNKMELGVAEFAISYPDYYKGKFDTKRIEVLVKDKAVPLQEVKWDKENHIVEIYPQEPVPANSRVELVFSNVKNPNFGGTYYFNCQILSPGDVPLLRYVGTWILNIG